MIPYIQLSESNCRHCMRCVRICPTKAMTYLNHQPKILEDECILCGKCYAVCPHSAKKVQSDLIQVKKWCDQSEEVILTVAPSFIRAWSDFEALKQACLKKGFSDVVETSQGAAQVSQQYNRLLQEKTMDKIISTCCPAVVALIEKEYPDCVDYLAPVVSPLVAHARKIKEQHPNSKVVFLTPCIAKKKEIRDARFSGVDATISMNELADWLQDDGQASELSLPKTENASSRFYPTPGGICRTLETQTDYELLHVEGIDEIRDCLEMLRNNELTHCFMEMSACEESCMSGPLLIHQPNSVLLGKLRLQKVVKDSQQIEAKEIDPQLQVNYQAQPIAKMTFSEQQIQDVLYMMGKTTRRQEHNCGACGYETCRDKAIAVLEGKADPKLCLPNALEQSESVSNLVIENTPNGIIVLDEKKLIKEINPAARHMLQLDFVNPISMPIQSVLPSDGLVKCIDQASRVQYYRNHYDSLNITLEHAILRIPNSSMTILILMDLTVEETKDKIMKEMRIQTMEITQQVIDDQMRTVQEIASLLGETTAKTKVALTGLKKAMEHHE